MAESAVIAVPDEATGQAVVAYVTVVGGLEPGPDLVEELRQHVGTRIGKFARPQRLIWAADLPKTRSGKIMRRLLRDIADGRELGDVTTLNDPAVVATLQKTAEQKTAEQKTAEQKTAEQKTAEQKTAEQQSADGGK